MFETEAGGRDAAGFLGVVVGIGVLTAVAAGKKA
jgi:hypothetical protein